MEEVIDGANRWPCHILGITPNNIQVQMLGDNGLNAVCSGPARGGQVDQAGNLYAVTLPGTFEGMNVTFRRP